MEIPLPQEKLVKLVAGSKENLIMDLTKLIGKLGSTVEAIPPAILAKFANTGI